MTKKLATPHHPLQRQVYATTARSNHYKVTRRLLLASALLASPALIANTTSPIPQAFASTDLSDLATFASLSAFLTGRSDLDPALQQRAYQALVQQDAAFPGRMRSLQAFIEHNNPPHVDILPSMIADHKGETYQTALNIISAWYLGRVGKVVNDATNSRPAFITYTAALMWKPTADATVIPTYARAGAGYWEIPPATLASD